MHDDILENTLTRYLMLRVRASPQQQYVVPWASAFVLRSSKATIPNNAFDSIMGIAG